MRRFSFVVVAAFAIAVAGHSTLTSAQLLPQNAPSNQNGINDPAEYESYLAAFHTQNPFTVADFITRYPQSSAVKKILEHLIAVYLEPENVGNGYSSSDAKLLELAKRLREMTPDDVRALAVITTLDRKRVNIDKEEASSEMCADAQTGLQQLPGWRASDGMKNSHSSKQRKNMADTFNGAAGLCAFQRIDLPVARSFYERALQLNPSKLEDLYQLTLTDLEMKPLDPNGFWYCGRVIQLLSPNHKKEVDALARYCETQYRKSHGAGDGWEQIVARAANEKRVPANFSLTVESPSTAP
jgi:hypothetical protein